MIIQDTFTHKTESESVDGVGCGEGCPLPTEGAPPQKFYFFNGVFDV